MRNEAIDNVVSQSIVDEWTAAQQIIATFLRDMRGVVNAEDNIEHNSAALLARLAQANLLVVHIDSLPDDARDWKPAVQQLLSALKCHRHACSGETKKMMDDVEDMLLEP
jgi:hypothetical protein